MIGDAGEHVAQIDLEVAINCETRCEACALTGCRARRPSPARFGPAAAEFWQSKTPLSYCFSRVLCLVAGARNPFCYNFWPGMAPAFRHEVENTHQLAA